MLPDLERWGPYAQEACDGAAGILVGSGHIAARLRQAVDDPETNAKVRLGPPGVDTHLFSPIPRSERRAGARGARGPAARARRRRPAGAAGTATPPRPRTPSTGSPRRERPAGHLRRQADRLQGRRPAARRLAARPPRPTPDARLLIVGFGALAPVLRGVWEGLAAGDLGPLRELAEHGRGLEERRGRAAADALRRSSTASRTGYEDAARAAAGSVEFAGRARARRGRRPRRRVRRARLPQHLPGGVRDGRRRGGFRRRAAGLGRALRRAEVSQALAAELPDVAGTWSRSSLATTRWRRSRRGCAAGSASTSRIAGGQRVAARHRGAPVELGIGRPRGARGLRRASSTSSRSRRAIEPLETSSAAIVRPPSPRSIESRPVTRPDVSAADRGDDRGRRS